MTVSAEIMKGRRVLVAASVELEVVELMELELSGIVKMLLGQEIRFWLQAVPKIPSEECLYNAESSNEKVIKFSQGGITHTQNPGNATMTAWDRRMDVFVTHPVRADGLALQYIKVGGRPVIEPIPSRCSIPGQYPRRSRSRHLARTSAPALLSANPFRF
jgi:hypothetical protein